MSIQAASSTLSLAASRAALLPFLYPTVSRCGSTAARRFSSTASTGPLRASSSSSRTAICSAQTKSRWLSTSSTRFSSASSSRFQSAAYPSTSSSPTSSSPPFASNPSSHKLSQSDDTQTASIDPACANLQPSSPASPKSQKDPRTSSPSHTQAHSPSPATPAPTALDPEPASTLTPSKAAQLAKDPKIAATMPQASAPSGSAPTTANKSSADRGTKFRSRTAALKLTPTAVLRLRALMESESGPKLIRVGVRNKGCAGMSYHLEYIKPQEAGRFDERVKQDGVEVLIDSKALFSIIGSEMDWQEDRLSAKFVFNNPNVKEACGCGESFLT